MTNYFRYRETYVIITFEITSLAIGVHRFFRAIKEYSRVVLHFLSFKILVVDIIN